MTIKLVFGVLHRVEVLSGGTIGATCLLLLFGFCPFFFFLLKKLDLWNYSIKNFF